MRGGAVLLALVVALTAGCVGDGSDERPGAVQQAVDALAWPDPATLPGRIQGVVSTRALEPIGGATVTLLRENVSTTTDASGLFRFTDLTPGSYLVAASAEGYASRSVVTKTMNGTVTDLNLTLDPDPRPAPYHETLELVGFLSCAFEAATPQGNERVDCAAADQNHRDSFEFPLAAAGRQVVLELVWDPDDNPGLTSLRLHAETVGYGANDLDLGEDVGEGYARIVVPGDVMAKYYPEGGAMRATVSMVADDALPAQAALQSRFTVHATAFYVEPGPDDFGVGGA